MANYWKQPGIPRKGWILLDVIDIREDDQSESDTNYETCMMCGNEKIRYVHVVEHSEMSSEFRVGCSCAEKMTEDYVNPARREKEIRNRSSRLLNWTKKQWKKSKNGTHYLKIEERLLLIFQDKKTSKYKVKIGDTFGKKAFDKIEKAKVAVFKGIEFLKEKGRW
ncbi:hypothetical protein ACFP1I_12510 [Dyadobacter subterraneus]|uniref:Uncharacterized protein n=1 Tax=Dyadobacter subterraneus TaxID=2773304 RepID=A0ABR9W988_9BACT|nr:hypothetical protein [Dyadobacter subterraneus]MBE9462052.1 hypothetical protein [Dyadobacter subterraneus]